MEYSGLRTEDENKELKKYSGEMLSSREEYNKRLIKYIKDIENEEFTKEEIPKLIHDLFENHEYKSHFTRNDNEVKLNTLLPNIKKQLAEYCGCDDNEIYIGNIDFNKTSYTTVPYKYIFGDVSIGSQIASLGDLTYVGGDVYLIYSQLTSLENLTKIGGDLHFHNSQITSSGNLTYIGGSAYFDECKNISFDNLTIIAGDAFFKDSCITSLGNLTHIVGSATFNDNLTDLGNLQNVGGPINYFEKFDGLMFSNKLIFATLDEFKEYFYNKNKEESKKL